MNSSDTVLNIFRFENNNSTRKLSKISLADEKSMEMMMYTYVDAHQVPYKTHQRPFSSVKDCIKAHLPHGVAKIRQICSSISSFARSDQIRPIETGFYPT
jgi:hypothetical protein